MDVTGGRVDVGMAEQGLHDRQINARFGKRGAERVAKCVRVAAWDASRRPVIAKDRAQARRGQRLTAVRSFGHHEQAGGLGLWTFGQQVGLNDTGHVHVEWNTALFGPFPLTRSHRPPMSTSRTSRASTSPARRPQNTINPAIARSRHVRRLPTKATTSPVSSARGTAGVLEPGALIAVSDGVPHERASRCARQKRAVSPPCPSGPGSSHRDHASLGTRTDPRSPPADCSPSPARIRRHAGRPCAPHSGQVDQEPLPAGMRRDSAAARRCSLRRDRSPRSSTTGRMPAARSRRRGPSAASSSDPTSSSGIRSPTRTGWRHRPPGSNHPLPAQAEAQHRSPQHL